MRRFTDYPFRDRPEINGALIAFALVALACVFFYLVILVAYLNGFTL